MTIQLTIPAQAEYVDVVRLTLYGIASKAGFSYEEIEDMKVAVSEACTNAVLHAYDDKSIGQIDLTFTLEQDSLHITIKDYGDSFVPSPQTSPPPSMQNKPLEEIVPGGLGLYMMQALMDRVEVHTDFGTEIILMKRMAGKEELV